jgi:hypothetical protein
MLKLDLQFFAAEEDLDLDSMLQEFENEWNDQDEEATDIEQEADVEVAEEPEQQTEEPLDEPQAETANPNDQDAEKRNRAFADLRRQADENRKYAEIFSKIAEQAGATPDELIRQWEERNLQQQAEQQNVPVEFYKDSQETKARLGQLEEQLRAERMELKIESVKNKYGADDNSIRDAFTYMLQSGVDPRVQDNVDFEKFYRAANLDSIIQKEVENARQKDLENKKQRQQAAIGNGTSVSPSSGGDMSDEEFDAILKQMDIRI